MKSSFNNTAFGPPMLKLNPSLYPARKLKLVDKLNSIASTSPGKYVRSTGTRKASSTLRTHVDYARPAGLNEPMIEYLIREETKVPLKNVEYNPIHKHLHHEDYIDKGGSTRLVAYDFGRNKEAASLRMTPYAKMLFNEQSKHKFPIQDIPISDNIRIRTDFDDEDLSYHRYNPRPIHKKYKETIDSLEDLRNLAPYVLNT